MKLYIRSVFFHLQRVPRIRRTLRLLGIAGCCLIAALPAKAQNISVPKGIAELFYIQYPYATDLKCRVNGNRTVVDFLMKNEQYEAIYKKNEWAYTAMNFSFDRLPEKIKSGFRRSRLDAADVEDVDVIYIPSGYETYRLLLKNAETTPRYQYFSESGKRLHTPPHQN
ncbi:hypothetical protein LQ567_08495 [Niabella pedocola]|uniref:Beta-lactamase-inhibitor-like PepSY-like domain-containing protein n=1 Tax=Niabella pedocola TaxID=1752077 RepID=A0ABS8PNW4_9BACT|nr:hypothetical protein [Niabella pedocola]MCD2422797.1 hypothetical protein [Niabella pedocola]